MTFSSIRSMVDLVDLGSASGFVDEIREIVKSLTVFEGFSDQESTLLCDYMECFGAPSHAAILKEGDPGDFMIILLTGRIDVVKADEQGQVKKVADLGPGAFLGEMSLFDGRPRFASCITVQPTDFVVLSRDRLNDILRDHPRLGSKLMLILAQAMTERLRDATSRMLPTIIGGLI